jgi:Zn-finger nucleic acid-binding protein
MLIFISKLETQKTTMNCAHCKNPMITAELEDVEIDFCGSCGGVWLDAGELESLLADETQSRQLLASFVAAGSGTEAARQCPICQKPMEIVYAGPMDKAILLDRCPHGHGLWFDRGELKQVLESETLNQNSKVIQLLKEMFDGMD